MAFTETNAMSEAERLMMEVDFSENTKSVDNDELTGSIYSKNSQNDDFLLNNSNKHSTNIYNKELNTDTAVLLDNAVSEMQVDSQISNGNIIDNSDSHLKSDQNNESLISMDLDLAIPEEHQNGQLYLADESSKSEHGSNSGSEQCSETQKANRLRDHKIRAAKQLYEQERQRRLAELLESQRLAEEFRKKQDEERQKKIEEARKRDSDRRRQVEERRRRLEQVELERKEQLLRKLAERDSRTDQNRLERISRSGMQFAFGSSTPREICENIPSRAHSAHPQCGIGGEDAHQRSHRRAVSCASRSNQEQDNESRDDDEVNSTPDLTATDTPDSTTKSPRRRPTPDVMSQSMMLPTSASKARSVRKSPSPDIMTQSMMLPTSAIKARSVQPSSPVVRFKSPLKKGSSVSMADVSSGHHAKSNKKRRVNFLQESTIFEEMPQPRLKSAHSMIIPSPITSPTTETHHKQINTAVKRSKSSGPERQKEISKKPKPVDEEKLNRLAAPKPVKKAADPSTKPPMPNRMSQSMIEDTTKRLAKPRKPVSAKTEMAPPATPTSVKKQAKPLSPRSLEPRLKKSEEASKKLMASSMIELPSAKKPDVTVTPIKKSPRTSPRPSELKIPKSQSAHDIKSSSAEEVKIVDSVPVSQILPDVDQSEAKRKFDEQRRLHRERLEAEKRAEEERKQKEEEFRKKRIEEAKRKEEEAKARAEEERLAREAEEKARKEEEARLQVETEQKLKLQEEEERAAKEAEEKARLAKVAAEEAAKAERLAAEEAARIERKKKLEAIMNRVKTNQNGPAAASSPEQESAMLPNSMTMSMPPGFMSNSNSNQDLASIAGEAAPASPALALLAGRLKGTKAAEILARHSSSTQNLRQESPHSSPEHKIPDHADDDEEVDSPALLSSNIETRLAEVRARLHTDNTCTDLEQVISLQKDENSESGVSSPGARGPDSPADPSQDPLLVL